MSENLKILAFVGMAGSGKSTSVDYMTGNGYPKVYFGGVVLDAVKEAGLELNEENERKIREELRAKEGNDFIAKRIIQQIRDLAAAGQHRVIADGLYSWTEYKALKHEFPGELTVVAVVAPKNIRYDRLADREVRPLDLEAAKDRDYSEIEHLEKGGPIAIADYYIYNEKSRQEIYSKLYEILQEIEF